MPRRFPRLRAFVGLAAALLLPSWLLAAPGDLDSTFGTGGKVITAIGSGHAQGVSVALQGDGKLVVAGECFNGSDSDFALVRYTETGALDTGFGGGTGKVITPVGSSSNDAGRSVALQEDGKIIVAGYAFNGSNFDFALVRYTDTGALDTSFGSGTGKVITAIGSNDDYASKVVVQGDGKIVVAGYTFTTTTSEFAVVRYTDTGALDTTFGGGTGKVTTSISGFADAVRDVALQSDGKLVACGSSDNGSGYDFALVRYTQAGALDTSFGGGTGKVRTAIGSSDDFSYAVALQSDGKIVVAGHADTGTTLDFALARYTDTDALDTTFGSGTGKVITPVGAENDFGYSVAVQGNGKIVIVGTIANTGDRRFGLVRYTATGALDTGFGGGTGKVITPIDSDPGLGRSVVVQDDGKIVVAGYAFVGGKGHFAVARYQGDPPVPTFQLQPAVQTAFVGDSVTFEALALGDPAPTYQWMKGTSPLDGETGTTLTLDGVTLEDAGSYSVVATNSHGSTPSASAALIVLQTSAPRIVQQPKDVKRKRGRSASLTVSATGTPPLSYQWYFEGGIPFLGETRPTLTFSAQNPGLGRYYVVVTNALSQTVQSRVAQVAAAGKALPAPKIKPESQSFSSTLTLQMTCAVREATIHYTTDGSLPDASSPSYDPASPPVLSQTSIVSAIALLPGSDRAQSPVSAVKRYFKASDSDVDLGTLDGNRLSLDDALGTALDTGIANDLDRYTFTTTQAQALRVSVSENTKRGPLMLDVIAPGGQTLGTASGRRGGAIQWESTDEQPAGTYTVRVRLPDGLLDAIDKLRHWPYRLTISGGPNWTMLAASGRDTTVHHVGLRALRPTDGVVAGNAAWVVSHGRASSPSAENIDTLARTLAAAEGASTQVLLVDWETAADDNLPTGLRGADWIIPVGKFMAERLQALGIAGAKLSLAGHSWGSYVIHEIGRQLTSTAAPPKRLVALDPAAVGGKAIKFSTTAQHSWSFFSSGFGSPVNAATAHDAFVLGVPLAMDNFAAHGAAVSCFSGLLRQHLENAGDTLAARFALDQIEPGHWSADQVRATYPDLDTFPDYYILPVLRPAGAKALLYPFEAGLFIDEEANVTSLLVPPGS